VPVEMPPVTTVVATGPVVYASPSKKVIDTTKKHIYHQFH
jgi:hypothetical protein